jgi:hypothetical protein
VAAAWREWGAAQIADWLVSIDASFEKHREHLKDWSGEDLEGLDDSDLEHLGVLDPLDRERIISAAGALPQAVEQPDASEEEHDDEEGGLDADHPREPCMYLPKGLSMEEMLLAEESTEMCRGPDDDFDEADWKVFQMALKKRKVALQWGCYFECFRYHCPSREFWYSVDTDAKKFKEKFVVLHIHYTLKCNQDASKLDADFERVIQVNIRFSVPQGHPKAKSNAPPRIMPSTILAMNMSVAEEKKKKMKSVMVAEERKSTKVENKFAKKTPIEVADWLELNAGKKFQQYREKIVAKQIDGSRAQELSSIAVSAKHKETIDRLLRGTKTYSHDWNSPFDWQIHSKGTNLTGGCSTAVTANMEDSLQGSLGQCWRQGYRIQFTANPSDEELKDEIRHAVTRLLQAQAESIAAAVAAVGAAAAAAAVGAAAAAAAAAVVVAVVLLGGAGAVAVETRFLLQPSALEGVRERALELSPTMTQIPSGQELLQIQLGQDFVQIESVPSTGGSVRMKDVWIDWSGTEPYGKEEQTYTFIRDTTKVKLRNEFAEKMVSQEMWHDGTFFFLPGTHIGNARPFTFGFTIFVEVNPRRKYLHDWCRDNVCSGLHAKKNVCIATVGNIALEQSIADCDAGFDGCTAVDGDRVLLRVQANKKENGVYDAEVVAGVVTLTRAADMPHAASASGHFLFVVGGTKHKSEIFVCTSTAAVGSAGATFVSFLHCAKKLRDYQSKGLPIEANLEYTIELDGGYQFCLLGKCIKSMSSTCSDAFLT